MNKMHDLKPSGRGESVRIALAILFGLMFFWYICVYATSYNLENETYEMDTLSIIFSLILSFNTVAVFVLSILHLKKYQEKGLAITALVFSSLFIFLCLGLLTYI